MTGSDVEEVDHVHVHCRTSERPGARPASWAATATSSARSSCRPVCPAVTTTSWGPCSGSNALRVSEACGADLDDLAIANGHRTLRIVGKGSQLALIPL
ncbi:MAG: hypothetical protein M3252_03005 [Actinomycetota bacterium]|nr:hypothetical protein [Actinomycetota bacterium]